MEISPAANWPGDEAIYAYVEAQLHQGDGAVRYPAVHDYLTTTPLPDAHYLALVALLRQQEAGTLESPPRPAAFNFGYLQAAAAAPLFGVELGRLVITLSRELLARCALATPPSAQVNAIAEGPLFETVLCEPSSGLKTKLVATGECGSQTWRLEITIEPPQRRWPHLGGIAIELAAGTLCQAQLTNTFGRVLFVHLPSAALETLTIRVGPVPELSAPTTAR